MSLDCHRLGLAFETGLHIAREYLKWNLHCPRHFLGISSSALFDSCFVTLFRVLVQAPIRSVSTTEQIYFWNRLTFLNKHLIFLRSLKEPFRGKSAKISDFRRLIYLRSWSVAGHLVTAYFKFKMLKYHTANALSIADTWRA